MSQAGALSHRTIESETHSDVDQSFRGPATLLIACAIDWLLIGAALGIIASVKLHIPDFLDSYEWLTYGRVEAAFSNAMIFGWIHNAAYAVGLWIMARLCRVNLPCTSVLFVAGLFWNLAVLLGVIGILAGDMTSVAGLGLPIYSTALIVFSYAVIAAWGLVAFMNRKRFQTYVSQWYFLAALVCFPWIYAVAQTMIFCLPSNGVMQALVSGWYFQSYIGGCLVCMGLGIAYYIIPKVLGKPIRFYYFAKYGFWLLIFLFGLTGARYLIGGPVPAWITTVSIAASVLLLVPATIIAANIYGTVCGNMSKTMTSPALRFIGFGFDFFLVFILLGAVLALRDVAETTRFTFVNDAYIHAGLFGFLSMVLFGGIYYMLPRILKRDWPCSEVIRLHWWLAAIGNVTILLSLLFAGWYQGQQLNNPAIPVADIFYNVGDWWFSIFRLDNVGLWLQLRTIGLIILAASFFIFALNFYSMICGGCCSTKSSGPADLGPPENEGNAR